KHIDRRPLFDLPKQRFRWRVHDADHCTIFPFEHRQDFAESRSQAGRCPDCQWFSLYWLPGSDDGCQSNKSDHDLECPNVHSDLRKSAAVRTLHASKHTKICRTLGMARLQEELAAFNASNATLRNSGLWGCSLPRLITLRCNCRKN